jgi:Spy/CpxP family protein refolding chaperone
MIFALALLFSAGCKGEKCYTPTPGEEVRADILEELDDAMDAMDATAKQRDMVKKEANVLISASLKLRKTRHPMREELIDELQKKDPSREKVEKISLKMSADAVDLYHDTVDVLVKLWPEFSQEQRKKLADYLEKPFEPLEESWLVDQFINYQLDELKATNAQRAMIQKLKKDYYFKINVLRRQAHRDRQVIHDELRKEKPNPGKAHRLIDAGAKRYDRIVIQLIEDGEKLLATTSAEQRAAVNAQFDRARLCKE